MKRCRTCFGQKYINGMGNMREKCHDCKGKGFVSEEEPLKVNAKEKTKKSAYEE